MDIWILTGPSFFPAATSGSISLAPEDPTTTHLYKHAVAFPSGMEAEVPDEHAAGLPHSWTPCREGPLHVSNPAVCWGGPAQSQRHYGRRPPTPGPGQLQDQTATQLVATL